MQENELVRQADKGKCKEQRKAKKQRRIWMGQRHPELSS